MDIFRQYVDITVGNIGFCLCIPKEISIKCLLNEIKNQI